MADILDGAQSNSPASPSQGEPAPPATPPSPPVIPSEPVVPPSPPAPPLDSLIVPPPEPPVPEPAVSSAPPPVEKPKKKSHLGVLLASLLFLVITIPILAVYVKQQVELRSKAAGLTGSSCNCSPLPQGNCTLSVTGQYRKCVSGGCSPDLAGHTGHWEACTPAPNTPIPTTSSYTCVSPNTCVPALVECTAENGGTLVSGKTCSGGRYCCSYLSAPTDAPTLPVGCYLIGTGICQGTCSNGGPCMYSGGTSCSCGNPPTSTPTLATIPPGTSPPAGTCNWACGGGTGCPPPINTICQNTNKKFTGYCYQYHCPNGCVNGVCGENSPGVRIERVLCSTATIPAGECGQIDTVDENNTYCNPGSPYCDVKALNCNCGITPPPPPQCINIVAYKDGNALSKAKLSALSVGDTITLAFAPGSDATKVRFRVNAGTWNETSDKNTNQQFIWNYTLDDSMTYTIEAQSFDGSTWN